MLVDDFKPHVLKLRQHVRQRDRRHAEDAESPPSVRADGKAQPEPEGQLLQPLHRREVRHRLGGPGVRLVRIRDRYGAGVHHGGGALDAELTLGLRGEVLVPGAHRGRDLGLQGQRVRVRQRAARLAVHHHVQPGERGVADHRAVVDGHAAERAAQDLLTGQPDLRGVPVPRQVHQAGHVPAVDVGAEEQPDLLALSQAQHGQCYRGQLGDTDLEQLLARVGLEDLDEVLPVVAVRGQPGRLEHQVELAAQHRDAGDRLGVGGLRIQAEEPVLAGRLAVRTERADRDVVQVARPVHGGLRTRLGQHERPQPLRVFVAIVLVRPGHWRTSRPRRGGECRGRCREPAAATAPPPGRPGRTRGNRGTGNCRPTARPAARRPLPAPGRRQ